MKINPPQVSASQAISHIFNFTQMTRSFLPRRAKLSPGISIQSTGNQHRNFCLPRIAFWNSAHLGQPSCSVPPSPSCTLSLSLEREHEKKRPWLHAALLCND